MGAVDWDTRTFHGAHHSTHFGTTYNAYLIVDENVALVDTVLRPFAGEMLDRISRLVDLSEIRYIIANHGEADHSGSILEVLKHAPDATVVCTKRGKESLERQFHTSLKTKIVKTGDKISLGKYTLTFIEAPMLHWPDSMFTYLEEKALLMPNDAFGQHLASSGRFDDEVDQCLLMEEARKYYANILTPFSRLVERKLEEIQKLGIKIDIIAPSHGVIWRSDPGKIIQAYSKWASGETELAAVVAYETMWGGTEAMARAIVEGLTAGGVSTKMRRLSRCDRSDVISEMLEARGVIVGSPTLNNGVSPQVAELLSEIKGLKFGGRVAAAFGCFGWGGGATKVIEDSLRDAGMEIPLPALQVKWHPDGDDLEQCFDFGKRLAEQLKSKS